MKRYSGLCNSTLPIRSAILTYLVSNPDLIGKLVFLCPLFSLNFDLKAKRMEKKEAGRILYNQGISQKDIAQMLSVQPKTVNLWVKGEGWDKQRSASSLAKETSEERVWKLISYQLRVVEKITELQEDSLDQNLTVGELKKLLIERGDIDALQKLFTTIKGKELEWGQVVKIVRELIEYVEGENLNLAKQLTPLANEFVNAKRKDS
jgi:transposase